MTAYEFRVAVADDPTTPEVADLLFETLGDVGPESDGTTHVIAFDVEADDPYSAIIDAIADMIAAGVEPLAVADELVSAADIARRTGRSRQSISLLIAGERGPGDFPTSIAGNARSPLWSWGDVEAWMARDGGYPEPQLGHAIDAANRMLKLRVLARENPRLQKGLARLVAI